jgi:iron complex outermembrane receptor protein
VAAAVAAILYGAGASAQTAAAPAGDAIEEVVVTGLRHSIETSIATKKQSESIIESVSAEDIGKLPDISIAESLARLPGLAAQRINGRATLISIRGMSPRYAATLLNGREMVSTGDNRSVEYDQFPSELINQANVYKTPDATLVGQGLSGTVDMHTVRPLDFSGRRFTFNARAENNSNGQLNADTSAKGARISASYIDQFADNTLGLALGFAYLNTPGQEEHYKSWWWSDPTNNQWGGPNCANANPCKAPGAGPLPNGTPDPGDPIVGVGLEGMEAGAASTQRIRDGLMAVIEYKPNDNIHHVVDLYYSKFNQVENRRTLMSDFSSVVSGWGSSYYTNPTTSMVDGNTIITGGDLHNLHPIDLSSLNKRQDDVKAAGWNMEAKLGNWVAVTDLSYSKAHREEQNAELESGLLDATNHPLPVDFNNLHVATGSGRTTLTPSISYADPATNQLGDPGGWGRDGRSEFPHVDDELKSARIGFKRDLTGFFTHFETGINYSERSKDYSRTEVYYYLNNNRTPVSVSSDLLYRPTSTAFGGIPNGLIAYNFFETLGKYYTPCVSAATCPAAYQSVPTDLAKNWSDRIWSVNEKVTTAHGKLNFKHESGAVTTHGNLGLQVVHARQYASGYYWDQVGQQNLPVNGGKSYTDILPSLNLVLDLPRDAYVRFGFAKEMARPNMEDMRAGKSISVGDQTSHYNWSASGGNPAWSRGARMVTTCRSRNISASAATFPWPLSTRTCATSSTRSRYHSIRPDWSTREFRRSIRLPTPSRWPIAIRQVALRLRSPTAMAA